jgi:hypothetical protein
MTLTGIAINKQGATPEECMVTLLFDDNSRVHMSAQVLADVLDSSVWYAVRRMTKADHDAAARGEP